MGIWMNSQKDNLLESIHSHLNRIYPYSKNHSLTKKIYNIFFQKKNPKPHDLINRWDQSDIAVITYVDTFKKANKKNIHSLEEFLDTFLKDSISTVHILPFFPYSSDDGFSITDYQKIEKQNGSWVDIKKLSKKYKLMSDLVINHCSSESKWFQQFIQNQNPGKNYFIAFKNKPDTQKVIRPRSHDLLQVFDTKKGKQFVWSTFSRDQVDLNFKNSDVLIEILKIIKFYLDRGISILRLDAVAFLWKEQNSECINLTQTHEIIRLIRLILDAYSNNTFLITETNLPNKENIDYFGNGNEANLIYNFSLPPLILHTLLFGNSHILRKWLMSMPPPMEGNTYFNFIASHDGIGIRPAEGLVPNKQIKAILKRMKQFGGHVSYRNAKHTKKPYEINIALIDALQGTIDNLDNFQIDRFICAHAIMLALEGIPGIYIHSLIGSENDHQQVRKSSHYRSINRRKYLLDEISQLINQPSRQQSILYKLKKLIKLRKAQEAFHPNATQYTLNLGDRLFGVWRQSQNRKQSIFAINNISDQSQVVDTDSLNLIFNKEWFDLISNKKINHKKLILKPYQTYWITNL